jgi:predicted aspartyl protease
MPEEVAAALIVAGNPRGRVLSSVAVRVVLVVTAVVTGAAAPPAEHRKVAHTSGSQGDKEAAALATIPFRWTPGQIEVQVSVNGTPPVWFIVDTGAEYSILGERLAQALQLGTFERWQRRFARGVSLRIGDVELRDQEVMILPLDNFRRQGRAIVGLVGFDFFERYVVEFDYLAHRLAVYEPRTFHSSRTTTVDLTFAGRLSVVPVTITLAGGRALRARVILDTGASQSLILRHPFAQAHGLGDLARQHPTTRAGSVASGTVTFLQLPVERLSLARWSIPGGVLRIYGDSTGAGGDTRTDGALGNEILRRFRMTVDYSRKQLHLEPNEHLTDPHPGVP